MGTMPLEHRSGRCSLMQLGSRERKEVGKGEGGDDLTVVIREREFKMSSLP